MEKACKVCGEVKPLTDYYGHSLHLDAAPVTRRRITTLAAFDPGLSGAYTIVPGAQVLLLEHLPVFATQHRRTSKVRHELDLHSIRDQLVAYSVSLAVIEAVGAMPGQGVTSMFRFGMATGQLMGLCIGLGMSLRLIRPQEWQRYHRIGGAPGAAKQTALQLYSHLSTQMVRKKDDHRADALLIGNYGLTLVTDATTATLEVGTVSEDTDRCNSIARAKGITSSEVCELVVAEMMSGRAWTFEQAFRNVEQEPQVVRKA
jgi:crossover junction endodeoxyribonuclease RuvC